MTVIMRTSATTLLLCALIAVFLVEWAAADILHGVLRTCTQEVSGATLTTRQKSRTYQALHGQPEGPKETATIATILTAPSFTTVPDSEEQAAEDEDIEEWLSLFVQGADIEESKKTADDIRKV